MKEDSHRNVEKERRNIIFCVLFLKKAGQIITDGRMYRRDILVWFPLILKPGSFKHFLCVHIASSKSVESMYTFQN